MKTKEEILNAELGTVNMDSAIEITCASLRAMQLYSDQQNKELREAMLNLQSECGYLQKFKDGVDAEIQRLTKEVEELGGKVEKWVFSGVALHAKNTRLRELLKKCEPIVSRYVDRILVTREEQRIIKEVLTDLDNALNPKP